jgi:RND family efflux transporter MFP subunit
MPSGTAATNPTTGAPPSPDLGRLKISRGEGSGTTVIRTGGARWPLVLLLFGLVGAGAWALLTGRLALQGEARLPTVTTARVLAPGAALARPGEVTGNGYVIARRKAALSTVLSGRLVEVNVEEGDVVKAGQILARIQHDDIDSQLATARQDVLVLTARQAELASALAQSQLEAKHLDGEIAVLEDQVRQAQVERDRAEADRQRNEALWRDRIIGEDRWSALKAAATSAEAVLAAAKGRVNTGRLARAAWAGEILRREAAIATAQAEVARAQETVRLAEILLEKTNVRAPFDGLVVHKDAEVGEVVAATGAGGNSRGSVATVIDPTSLEVQVELAETRLGTIGEGDPTRIVLDAATDRTYPGRVRQVWPTADRQKATVEMRIEFTEWPPLLKPEMGARVTFLAKETGEAKPPDRPRVPERAVVTREGVPSVLVVTGGVVRRVPVEVGSPAVGGFLEVLSGLSGGEAVVIDPPTDLADGARVSISKEAP